MSLQVRRYEKACWLSGLIIRRSWARAPPAPPAILLFLHLQSWTGSWTDVAPMDRARSRTTPGEPRPRPLAAKPPASPTPARPSPGPHRGNPELDHLRQTPIRALELRDEAEMMRSMTRGELEARILDGDRALASAPPDVSRELRLIA